MTRRDPAQLALFKTADDLLREKRGPDLQQLVLDHGGYDRITPEAWAAYDRELAEWRLRVAAGDFHRPPYAKSTNDAASTEGSAASSLGPHTHPETTLEKTHAESLKQISSPATSPRRPRLRSVRWRNQPQASVVDLKQRAS